eukprot:COSAG05_NODE_12497_length_465_cov_4.136612_1_plen_58_part_10
MPRTGGVASERTVLARYAGVDGIFAWHAGGAGGGASPRCYRADRTVLARYAGVDDIFA